MYYNSKNKVCLSVYEKFSETYYCPECNTLIEHNLKGDFQCSCGFLANIQNIVDFPNNIKKVASIINQNSFEDKDVGEKLKIVVDKLEEIGDVESAKKLSNILYSFIKISPVLDSDKLRAVMLLKEAIKLSSKHKNIEINVLGFRLSKLIIDLENLLHIKTGFNLGDKIGHTSSNRKHSQ